ncbi:response regulator [Modestobacter sp. SSW1-42]|uniref:response regulator n=1 Tax=Modestobacter sp. SSW1-42 TaxID=596372 RepID=UPI003987BC60
MTEVRVLLVDDQAMIRSGIRGLLELAEGMVVVGEAADGRHAVSMARALRPDVVLMDLQMPGVDGVQAIRAIRADESIAATPVLVLTTFEKDDNVLVALQSGANGFLGKSAGHDELMAAVRAVAAGESSLSSAATTAVVSHLARTAGQVTARDQASAEEMSRLAELTAREREVVALAVRGLTNDEIAAHLFLSSLTVKTHVNRAMRKLQVSDRARLVVAGMRAGLLDRP